MNIVHHPWDHRGTSLLEAVGEIKMPGPRADWQGLLRGVRQSLVD